MGSVSCRASTFGRHFVVSRGLVVLVVKRLGGGRDGGKIAAGLVFSGVFLGGRALLGPGPTHQAFLHLRRNCWKASSFSGGISVLFTWLAALKQSAKQNPRMNQRGHILHVPFQSTLSEMHLFAKCVAQVSVWRIPHDSGGESFETRSPSLPCVLPFFFF